MAGELAARDASSLSCSPWRYFNQEPPAAFASLPSLPSFATLPSLPSQPITGNNGKWAPRVVHGHGPSARRRLPLHGCFMKRINSEPGSGSPPGGGGNGGRWWVRWWHSGGGGRFRPAQLFLAIILIYFLVSRQLQSINQGPLPWSEVVTDHLQGVAAEWGPVASAYAQEIRGSDNIAALITSIQNVIDASTEDRKDQLWPDTQDDKAVLMAAAVACVVLSDLSCRTLLPRIVLLRQDVDFWERRMNSAFRLGLETLSLPLGLSLSARFPHRSLQRRLHDCKVMERNAEAAAATAAEAVGRLHEALALLAKAQDVHSLRNAVHQNTILLEEFTKGNWGDYDRNAYGGTTRHVLLRLKRCADAHTSMADMLEEQGVAPGYGRPNLMTRHWPEVVLLAGLAMAAPDRFSAQNVRVAVSKGGEWARDGAKTLFKENLQGPLERIAEALFGKHVSPQLEGTLEASRQALARMVESFNYDMGKSANAGMKGVMRVYEQEVRAPLKGAMNGRLFRAGLIQVQEMKVNFETEMETVQKLLEAQQLNLQIVSMLPALGLAFFTSTLFLRTLTWLTLDPFRPSLDLEGLLHGVNREVYSERTAAVGSASAYRARGARCLLAWQAGSLLRNGKVTCVSDKEMATFKRDVARLADPDVDTEHLTMLLDVVFRQVRRA